MATPDNTADTGAVSEAVIDEEHKGFPVVWLLPLVAVLVGGWLIFRTLTDQAPTATIQFQTAEGIQAGKTKIKSLNITLGVVESVEMTADLERVLVNADNLHRMIDDLLDLFRSLSGLADQPLPRCLGG